MTTHRHTLAVIALLLGLALPGLAKKFPLTAAPSVPAASGSVDVGKDKNGNTKLDIRVKHLAKPSNLTPPKTTYIVWVKGPAATDEAVNEGQLAVNKNLEASLTTSTPLTRFDVFVTAEEDPQVKSPAGAEVLRGSIQR